MATWCQTPSFVYKGKNYDFFRHNMRLCVTPDKNTVGVDLTCACEVAGGWFDKEQANVRIWWTMDLQRYNGSTKKWTTIGTREGYVERLSPSQRTFTNIAKKNAALRVQVRFYDKRYVPPQYITVRNSTSWTY